MASHSVLPRLVIACRGSTLSGGSKSTMPLVDGHKINEALT